MHRKNVFRLLLTGGLTLGLFGALVCGVNLKANGRYTNCAASTINGTVECNFNSIPDYSSWSTSKYERHVVEYDNCDVIFASAKRLSLGKHIPITNGGDVEVIFKNRLTIQRLTMTCEQYALNPQYMTLHTSIDGGQIYTSTSFKSSNFVLTANFKETDNINAVKFTFQNQNDVSVSIFSSITYDPKPEPTVDAICVKEGSLLPVQFKDEKFNITGMNFQKRTEGVWSDFESGDRVIVPDTPLVIGQNTIVLEYSSSANAITLELNNFITHEVPSGVDVHDTNHQRVNEFIRVYLHMWDYRSEQGLCTTYYPLAKAYYSYELDESQKDIFKNETTYQAEYARFRAWMAANGDIFSPKNGFIIHDPTIYNNIVENNITIIAVTSSIAVVTIVTVLVIAIKKRKKA